MNFLKFVSLSILLFVLGCAEFQRPNYAGSGPYVGGSVNLEADTNTSSLINPYGISNPGFKYQPQQAISFDWPVDRARLTQRFSPPSNPSHQGIDLSGPKNTSIYAAHEGVVVYAGKGFRGYGNMVLIEFDSDWATLYGHLNKIDVKTGQVVDKGEVIGLMGRTGRATGVHLHFEVIKNKQPIDPLSVLPTTVMSHKPHKWPLMGKLFSELPKENL